MTPDPRPDPRIAAAEAAELLAAARAAADAKRAAKAAQKAADDTMLVALRAAAEHVEDAPAEAAALVQAALAAAGRDRARHDRRAHSLARAAAQGATAETIDALLGALRVSRQATIILPAGRYEHLSRGRGWCRQGRGQDVTWGDREDGGGYRVGPGRWTVGSTDGYSRKSSDDWRVSHVQVGEQTWTVAR